MKERKSGAGKFIFVIVILLLLVIAGGIGIIFIYGGNSGNAGSIPSSSDEAILFTVEEGASTTSIATSLEVQGFIESASSFKLKSKLKGYDGEYKAGVYGLSKEMTDGEIMSILVSGKQSTQRFTVPEGLTVKETAAKIAEAGICTYEDFMNEACYGQFDYWFLEGITAQDETRLEGFLYPNTYDVFLNATAHDVVNRMLMEFDKQFDEEMKTRMYNLQYTARGVATIASMIEAETKVDEERPLVASVIMNRLGIGMKLQIDATVLYALGERKERVYESDLKVDSPYNTYLVQGLPAGPICSPRKASLQAALFPAETNYLFYVLKPELSGAHNFAATEAEFFEFKSWYINAINNR